MITTFFSIIGILITIIFALLSGKRRVKEGIMYIQQIYYMIKYKKIKPFATNLLNRKHYVIPILDEMIGYYQSSHIGIYTFHNGVIDLSNQHLLKVSMIDERSRYFSIIKNNQSIPLNIYADIILHCSNNNYYELDVNNTTIMFLKEQFKILPTINFVYYTIYWDYNKPQFMITICINNKLNEEQLNKIFDYKVTIKKIINYELEQTKYQKLYE